MNIIKIVRNIESGLSDNKLKSLLDACSFCLDGIRDAKCSGNEIQVWIDDSSEIDEVIRKLDELIEDITSESVVQDELIYEYKSIRQLCKDDPLLHLLDNGLIINSTDGQYSYSGDYVSLIESLDKTIESYCISELAEKCIYPSLIDKEDIKTAGYLDAFPHLALGAAPFKRTAGKICDKALLEPEYVLAPTVCYHCFAGFKNKQIDTPKAYTAINKCHRNETHSVVGLERLKTYLMREIIFFGEADFVVRSINRTLEFTKSLLEYCDIPFEVHHSHDAFFLPQLSNRATFQSALKLKQEIKIKVKSGNSIAVASFNNHLTTLSDKFNILSNCKSHLYSGCVGWGMERLTYALMCYLGPDIKKWPEHVKSRLAL